MSKKDLRSIIYRTTKSIDAYLSHSEPHIFVLCYHDISKSKWRFSVSETMFKKQMEYLLSRYAPLTLKQIEDHVTGKNLISKSGFVITFDDGYRSILSVADYCNSLHIIPTVFLLSHPDLVNRNEIDNTLDLLTNSEIHALKKYKWDLQSHGATHADFYSLDENRSKFEIDTSKRSLSKITKDISYIAYPKGAYTSTVLAQVKKSNYTLGLTMDDALISRETDPFHVPRIGVDGSHSFEEFTSLFLPTSIRVRKVLRMLPFGKSI